MEATGAKAGITRTRGDHRKGGAARGLSWSGEQEAPGPSRGEPGQAHAPSRTAWRAPHQQEASGQTPMTVVISLHEQEDRKFPRL